MEDETEFRDLIIKKLENNGVLLKLKAALRAQIHNLVDTDSKSDDSQSMSISDDSTIDSHDEATNIALSLIQDLLECFSLNITKSVFQSESGEKVKYVSKSRTELLETLQISDNHEDENKMEPLTNSKSIPVLVKFLRKNGILTKSNVNETYDIPTTISTTSIE